MEAVILTQTFRGWVPQCYRITSCKLIQFKQRFTTLDSIIDNNASQIHQQHDINNMQISATLNRSNESILQIDINHIQLFLKFYFNKEFVAWFRVLSASKQPINRKCMQRPVPSNISFAMYHILQNLYFKSKDIFDINISNNNNNNNNNNNIQLIKKLHYDLIVNNNSKNIMNTNINILYHTLIYTLQHMPTSLFCYKYQQILSNLAIETFEERESAQFVPSNTKDNDKYVALFNDQNTLNKISNELVNIYSQSDKKENGFNLFDRFGYLTLLFAFLHHMLKQQNMSISFLNKLTNTFAKCLRSKQSDHQSININKLEKQKENFKILIKILIYYSTEIFPKRNWKMSTLINYDGNEQLFINVYNGSVQKIMNKRQLILTADKLQQNVDIGNRKYRFKTYKQCFVARQAIPVIVNLKLASNTQQAITFGNTLMRNNIIKHVQHLKEFKNGYFFYVFIPGYNASKSLTLPQKIQNVLSSSTNVQFNAQLFASYEQKKSENDMQVIQQTNIKKTAQKQEKKEKAQITKETEEKEEIKEYSIGEYMLPLKTLFAANHPGYKTELQLQNINRGILGIQLKCKEVVDDDDDMFTSYNYVVDLEIFTGFNLVKTAANVSAFIVINVEDETQKTKAIKYNRNFVEWNEKFNFVLDEQPEMLYFNVYNKTYNENNNDNNDNNNKEADGYKINIDVISGYNLNISLLPITYNPFVVVKVLNKEFQTNKIMNNSDPRWNQSKQFVFKKTGNYTEVKQILFQVYNDRQSPEIAQLLGEVYYDINQQDNGKVVDVVINSTKGAGIKVKVDADAQFIK